MRISDWSSDVCSSDLLLALVFGLLLTRYVEREERAVLTIEAVELASEIEQRMNASEALLRAAATAFAFVPRIDAAFFSSYFQGLHLYVESSEMSRVGKEWVSACCVRWGVLS